jgi:hypothetical protein
VLEEEKQARSDRQANETTISHRPTESAPKTSDPWIVLPRFDLVFSDGARKKASVQKGYTMAQTTMRYAHLQDEALRAATNQFGKIFLTRKSNEPEAQIHRKACV